MRYKKKPLEIEAIQYDGKNLQECSDFCNGKLTIYDNLVHNIQSMRISVETLEGIMLVSAGDYIIKGVKGELYPCKPDVFELTYESL